MSIPTDLSALKQVINKPKEDEGDKEEVSNVQLRTKPYSEDDLTTAWQEFTSRFKVKGLHQEVLLLEEPYRLQDHQITVSIPNEALELTFEKFRSDLLQHLRDKLQNDQITLNSQVIEIKREKMRYTDREKFDYLKEKYPALRDLQEKLGLDPEF